MVEEERGQVSNEIVKLEEMELTARERAAYKLSVDRKEPFLSPGLSDQCYSLFEAGHTCEEIHEVNKGLSLGTIVRARVDHHWDERRLAHFESLRTQARTQAQHLALDSLSFLGDLMSAIHKHDREKLQRFILTGDTSELATVLVTGSGFKTYKEIIELLLKLTGQDATKTQNIHGEILHHHTVEQTPPVPAAAKPLTPGEAAQLLEGFVVKRG